MTGFEGVHAAAVTPRGPKGDIDFGASFELIDYFSKAGLSGIVLFASEGEYPAFTAQERSRLVYLAVKRSRVPVLAGVGSATLDGALALAREAAGAGAAALLVPPPHFFRYDQDDIRAFYEQFAAEAGRDARLLLYHSPETSSIAPETAAALLAGGRFCGVVDAGDGDGSFRCLCGNVLGGDAALLDEAPASVVSGAACAAPQLVVALHRALRCGASAEPLRGGLRALLEHAAGFPRPALWKACLALRGVKTGYATSPLSTRKQREMDEFRQWFPAWLAEYGKMSANA
ncbi:MAG TPA: dihydrodipicolinate synthase family protein [Bryobacteraceae bacterium]|nr:dihydrodipicolinate synthase family protein [Bryobacteraceae bacterium]